MQYLDDDMSELFLKASEDIRLRPEDDDWDKIRKRLLPAVSTLPGVGASAGTTPFIKQNKYRLWVYTFIILIISGAGGALLKNGKPSGIDNKRFSGISQIVKSETRSANENNAIIQRLKTNSLPVYQKSFKPKGFGTLYDAEQKNAAPTAFYDQNKLENIETPFLDLIRNADSAKKQAAISKGKGLYIGILAGPQYSQTKQQGFNNAGFSAGLLLEFCLNSKLSIESGIILSNKYYTSAGDYFNMSKLSATMPSGMKLIHVQSKIHVLEIPINMKYDVLKIKTGALFVSGGISSYLLTNENNQYQASLNGIHETITGNYTEHHNYFAAAVNISAGYECRAGKNIKMRFEPYFQIPIKTIGMGSMHVQNAGIYLSISAPVIK